MEFDVLIPDGYEVVETDQVVASSTVFAYTHFFGYTAKKHAERLNALRKGPLLRYVAEPTSGDMRYHVGWFHRWAVVPYQNVLRKEEHG